MKQLDRLLEVLDALARWVAMALATIIIAILFVQIFYRYVLNTSIVWSEEVATWCLVWLVFVGSAAIMRRWEHVHIPMLIRRLPLGARPGVIIFVKLATDRKSTRLNSSHLVISYAVFCLKKKK